MKKQFKYYMIIMIIAALGITAYLLKTNLYETPSAALPEAVADLEPIGQKVNGINVMIDPRMELLAALQAVSNYDSKYDLITNEQFSYKSEMISYFLGFSSDKAVKTFDDMSGVGFAYDAPPQTMLYLSNSLNIEPQKSFSDELKIRVGEDSLKKFAEQIKGFAIASKFEEFYNNHKDFYRSVVEKNAEVIKTTNYIDIIEKYYGTKQNSYNIILSPMFHNGGFGPRVKDKEGSYDIYEITGTASVKDDIPIFGDENQFRYIAFHEFSHSFVNPETEVNRSEINKYNKLFKPIKEIMSEQAYNHWETCVNEHIVRAVVARLTSSAAGKEAYDSIIHHEKERGFFYIEPLAEKLKEFESNRDKYKTFKEFYPELIKVFQELSEKNLGEDFYKI